MKHFYIVHHYNRNDDLQTDYFVADDTKDLKNQFIRYFVGMNGWQIYPADIVGIYEVDKADDDKGRRYQVSIKQI